MTEFLTLTETATLLGVSKETMRNWDKAGKLSSVRHPQNNYRQYRYADALALKDSLLREQSTESYGAKTERATTSAKPELAEDQIKRELTKIHKALRDTDGNSSLLERFDELTKLLFLKVLSERGHDSDLFSDFFADATKYAGRLRNAYRECCVKHSKFVPPKFRELNLSDEAIYKIGLVLGAVNLSTSKSDLKGLAYEEILRNTFEKGDNQQFFTPRPITSFLVSLMEPMLSGSVCDPASGTGGFLADILRHNINPKHIVALEVDERLAWISGVNLFLSGSAQFESIFLGNGGTLGQKGRQFAESFNAIITNPPFGSDFSDLQELGTFALGKGLTSRRRGILFIERCLQMLKKGGHLGIVIDEGVLSLPSAADVRNYILENAEILAVISLPETTFMPYASVHTSILLLKKTGKKAANSTTFYARADKTGRKPNGDPDMVFDEEGQCFPNSDLPKILTAWQEYQSTGRISSQTDDIFLSNTSILTQNGSLDNRIDYRYHHPARLKAAAALKSSRYSLVTLAEVCSDRNETFVPSLHLADQTILYTGLAHIESRTGVARQVPTPAQSLKSAVKKYYHQDILFARMRPNLRKVTHVDFEKSGYTSSECIVFTVRRSRDGSPLYDPRLLAILLRSDFVYGQIVHLVAGIGRPRISITDLRQIKIPLAPLDYQISLKQRHMKAEAAYKELHHQALSLRNRADTLELQAIEEIAESLRG